MNDATKSCPFCAEEIKASAILCKHCGSTVTTSSIQPILAEHEFKLGRCVRCGVSSFHAKTYKSPCKALEPPTKTIPQPELAEPTVDQALRCPKCGTIHLTVQKQGFGAGKALAGVVLTGAVGLLAGFVGGGKVKVTCLTCGHAWKRGK